MNKKTYVKKDKNGNLKLDIEQLTIDLLDEFEFLTLRDTEEILVYGNGYWRLGGEEFIKRECQQRVGVRELLTIHKVNEVIGHIQRTTYIDRAMFNNDKWIINLENGLLDIRNGEVKPHTPDFKSTIRIPLTYNPNADCPCIKKFLIEVLEPADIPVVEELFGYCLIPDYSIQRAFLLVGDGANGKSTLLNLLKTFIGKDNCSNVPWHALELDRFAKSGLEGKLVNMFADMPSKSLSITGTFKMLTGGDTIGTEKKFRDYFSFVNYARLVFSANKPPKVYGEDSYAFWRRWIVLTLPNQFIGGSEDKQILSKLTTDNELSGLFNLALAALQRLLNNQGYSYTKSVEETTDIYLRASDPIYAFVADCCELNVDAETPKSELYQAFKSYCTAQNIPILKANSFARQLQNNSHFEVKSSRKKVGDERVPIWQGIKCGEVGEDGEVFSTLKAYLHDDNKVNITNNLTNPTNPVTKAKKPEKCFACGKSDFWQRVTGEWVCSNCRPDPNRKQKEEKK